MSSVPVKALSPDLVQALAKLVADYADGNLDATGVTVLPLEEESYQAGYCETCAYTDYQVWVRYTYNGGIAKSYTYDGSFADLINRLVD